MAGHNSYALEYVATCVYMLHGIWAHEYDVVYIMHEINYPSSSVHLY